MSSVDKKHQVSEDVVDGHTKSTPSSKKHLPLDRLDGKSQKSIIGKSVSETESNDIIVLEKLIQEVSGLPEESRKKALQEFRLLKENYEEVKRDPSKYKMFAGMANQKNIKQSNRTDTLKRNAFYLGKTLDLAEQQMTGNQQFVEDAWSEFVLLLNADFVYKLLNQKLQTGSLTEVSTSVEAQSVGRKRDSTTCASSGERYPGNMSKTFTLGDTSKEHKVEAMRQRSNSEIVKMRSMPQNTGQISNTKDVHVTTTYSSDKMPDLHVSTTRAPDQQEDVHAKTAKTTDQCTDLHVSTTKTPDQLTNLHVSTTKTTSQGADMHVSTTKTSDKSADGKLIQQEESCENMEILQDDNKFKQDSLVPKHKQCSLKLLLHNVKDSQQKEKAQMEYMQLLSCFENSYGRDALQKNSSGCDNIEIRDITLQQKDVARQLYSILSIEEKTGNENLTLAVVQYLKLTEHKLAHDSKMAKGRASGKEASQQDIKGDVYGATAQAVLSSSLDKPRSKGHGDKQSCIHHFLMSCKVGEEMENLRHKAMREYQRLHHSEQLLMKDYPLIESTRENESQVKGPDDILDHESAPKLFNFLRRLSPQWKGYLQAWKEYDRLLQSEQLLIMAQITVKPQGTKCKHGAITNSHVLIPRTTLNELKQDLCRKDEQINDLTTRLSRYASQLLLDNNPNIADLSDKNRPTRLGEMFGILYDDQWSEAFEAITQSKSPCGLDDLCVEILELLQRIVMTCFNFCQQETRKQFEKVKNSMTISFTVGDVPSEREVAKELSQFTNRQTKSCMISAAGICHLKAAQVFCDKVLPSILQDKQLQTEPAMLAYVKKCVELCWYMCVQDPPMTIKCPNKGETINLSSYAYHHRKGKVVWLCVWPAVFLYEGGPLVKKGFVLPS